MNDDVNEILTALEQAAASGAELALEMFAGGGLSARLKADGSPVTRADVQVEERIKERLAELAPRVTVVGEETTDNSAIAGDFISVDPIDGTSNFMRGTPFFAVTLAYLSDGWPQAGVVLDPVHNVTYSAARGHGATRNGKPLSLEGDALARTLDRATVSVPAESLPRHLQERFLGPLAGRINRMQNLRSVALELAGLAAGWIDATVFASISVWDVAAACLLVEEAGGVWTAIDGTKPAFDDPQRRYSVLAASNPDLHGELLELIETAG